MKKLLSAILALALLLSVWSFPVVAEDGQAEDPAVAQGAEEEAGEEEGEPQEGTVLIVSEDPEPEAEEPEEEPEAEEPEAEEPEAGEPEAEEPEAEEPVKEEPVAEEPEAEEPEAEEPVKEEPVAEEPEAEEPVAEEPEAGEPEAEEPVKEEPVAEEPEAGEPEAEEPVKEEPVAEEPEAEEPVAEEPVAEEPVKEEPVKEEPEAEEPVAEEPVAEEPVAEAPVHFEQGYVSIKKGAKAYAEASKKEEYGLFTADAIVYAESEKQQEDPAKDWLKITFAADGALETAYVQAGTVKALEAGEAEALEAKLEKDAEAKEYKGHKLPVVSFVKPEAPVAEETVTKEATGQMAPAEEAEEATLEAAEEEAPKATEKEAAPKQQEAAPKQEDMIAVKDTAKVSASVKPRVASGKLDETVSFGVMCKNAAGKTGYQWQSTADGGKTWEDLAGNTAASLKVAVTEKNAQKKYRCLVTTDEGTAVSNECKINGTLSAYVTPTLRAVNYGGTVNFKVQVSFASSTVTYQWQESADNGKTWTRTKLDGNKTRSLKIRAKKDTLTKKYRCVVKAGGEKAYTNTIMIYGARIPQTDTHAKIGDTVKLNVNIFNGAGEAQYQWQVSPDQGKTWQNSEKTGNTTKKLTISVDTVADLTNYYRCLVTCANGTVYSNAVKFKGELSVDIQRNVTNAEIGSTVRLISSVAFSTGDVSYTWQYSTDDGSTWKVDTAMQGAKPALTVDEKKLTRLYRCEVNDKKGSATSNAIRLIDFTLGEVLPVYRALLIGMEHFYDETCTRNRGDVEKMAALLSKATAPGGTKYEVTQKIDLGKDEVRQAIESTFAATKETDVSLFMISTHGVSDDEGQLCCTPNYELIHFATLASWLNTYVRGKVIVILESCGSGSAIYEEGVAENAANAAADTAEAAFVEQAVAAFAAADKGVTEAVANMEYNAKGELVVVNTGELRTDKFYVLTASRHHELSWGAEDEDDPSNSGNYFIKWLIEGIGKRGNSPADTSPKNRVFTLEELFSYIKRYNTFAFFSKGMTYNQHVQRYPKNCTYPILMFP